MGNETTVHLQKKERGTRRGEGIFGAQFPEKFRVPLDLVGQLEACGTRRTEISLKQLKLGFEFIIR